MQDCQADILHATIPTSALKAESIDTNQAKSLFTTKALKDILTAQEGEHHNKRVYLKQIYLMSNNELLLYFEPLYDNKVGSIILPIQINEENKLSLSPTFKDIFCSWTDDPLFSFLNSHVRISSNSPVVLHEGKTSYASRIIRSIWRYQAINNEKNNQKNKKEFHAFIKQLFHVLPNPFSHLSHLFYNYPIQTTSASMLMIFLFITISKTIIEG